MSIYQQTLNQLQANPKTWLITGVAGFNANNSQPKAGNPKLMTDNCQISTPQGGTLYSPPLRGINTPLGHSFQPPLEGGKLHAVETSTDNSRQSRGMERTTLNELFNFI